MIAAAATAAADNAWRLAEGAASGEGAGPVELDEFGRDVGLSRRQEAERRAARRRERQAARKALQQRSKVAGMECCVFGWLSCNIADL